MPTSLRNVCFDAADPYKLATFWSQVVGRPIPAECEPGEEETYIEMPEGPNLFFQRVPETKVVKNRVHVCLTPEIKRYDPYRSASGTHPWHSGTVSDTPPGC